MGADISARRSTTKHLGYFYSIVQHDSGRPKVKDLAQKVPTSLSNPREINVDGSLMFDPSLHLEADYLVQFMNHAFKKESQYMGLY